MTLVRIHWLELLGQLGDQVWTWLHLVEREGARLQQRWRESPRRSDERPLTASDGERQGLHIQQGQVGSAAKTTELVPAIIAPDYQTTRLESYVYRSPTQH
jgi:hypothetical protein